jgi:Ser/Thr protein kinase RdoA (MazF antagonist)
MEKVAGVKPERAIRWARLRPGAMHRLSRWFAASGEWLGVFHNVTEREGVADAVFERIEREFFSDLTKCRERGLDGILASSAARQFEKGKAAAFDPRLKLVGRHCDFAPYNVLVSGSKVTVIDFEGLQQGLQYDDLCYFICILEATPPYHLSRAMAGTLRQAFLRGYQQHAGLDHAALDFFMLVAGVKVMANSPILAPDDGLLASVKRRQRLRFYDEWFREKLA